MKILWLTNVPLAKVRNHISNSDVQLGGWLDGMSNELLKFENVEFLSIFPYKSKTILKNKVENIEYCTYPSNCSDKMKKNIFESTIREFNPDIIHIFGTEYKHSLIMLKVCEELNLLDKAIVNIQGLCSKISQVYYSDLPQRVIHSFTLRDFIKMDNISLQKKKFAKRGKWEIEALKLAKNVVGRTDWDRACTKQSNPNVNYYHCDATLRGSFYQGGWEYEKCEKHSIFVAQSGYPIKGFHKMLQALPHILKQYPNAKVYTTGKNLLNLSAVDRLKMSSYQKYLIKLIKKNSLQTHVEFLGMLNEYSIKERYLKSNCFVLCSSIENESNALGEAMILGVPSVASCVGGVPSRIIHNKDGFIYGFSEEYMLAHYVCEIFNRKECSGFSKNSKQHATECYSREQNLKDLLSIYKRIYNNKEI